jgi:16S rRNA (adenine1518-N6/adenine1519-N6)-dimethyltransferase
VIAVETDTALASELKERAPENVDVIPRSILEIDFDGLVPSENIKVAGNLPYSISGPILFKVMDNFRFFRECYFLLQKEVADRLASGPGTKAFAPLSALIQNIYSVQIRFIVSPGNFSPPPKVQSAFISMHKREQVLFPEALSPHFRIFLTRCFQHRRKTLANNLKAMGTPAARAEHALKEAGLPAGIRPEKVALTHFVKLYQFISQI